MAETTTIQRILALATSEKWADDVLDELVHESSQESGMTDLNATEDEGEQENHIAGKEEDASTVNNGGHESQITFLLDSGVTEAEIVAAGRGEDAPLHKGCECAYCNEVIEEEEDGESTPAGSMHASCATKHEQENPEDW